MAVPEEKLFWTVEEYFEFEKTSEVRHEYVDGVIYPVNFDFEGIAGESKRHNLISGELYAALLIHLRGSGCQVFFEAVKLYTSASKYYYPDVVVTCDAETDKDDYTLNDPRLIIEVLSPTTERVDRAEKLIAYQKIPSVQEYVLVSSERVWVQIYRRTDGENWRVEQFLNLNDEVTFNSINLIVKVADIYRNITFPPPKSET